MVFLFGLTVGIVLGRNWDAIKEMVGKLYSLLAPVFIVGFFLMGCGQEKVSWDTQEAARQQALDNSQFNANVFRNATYPNHTLKMRGDSTIGPDCKYGDGWATVDLIPNDGTPGNTIKLKCSTVSSTIGCMTDKDFKDRPQYANQDGHCNNELPFPLPKILK